MNVIIVEDESIAARRLQRMLADREINVIEIISTVKELKVQLAKKDQPELFFFDIHLSDGLVFDALAEQTLSTPIIFTTAYDQYAIKAFKQNSIDYLLKPVDGEELDAALAKYKNTIKPQINLEALSSLILGQQTQPATEYRERISVRVGDKIKTYSLKDILFFYSESKMNYLFTAEGRSYPIEKTIEQVFSELNPKDYYRVNRGYIISITAISEIITYSNSRLKVKVNQAPDHEIIVSREKVKDFKAWIG